MDSSLREKPGGSVESKAELGALQHQAGGREVHRSLGAEFCKGGA